MCGHAQTHSQDCEWELVVVRASAPHEFGSLVPAARTRKHRSVWRANLHREGGTAHAPEPGEVNHEAIAILAQRRPDPEASNHAHTICAMRGMCLSARRMPKHAWHFTWWRDRHEEEGEHVLEELDPLARRRVPRERSVCLRALDSRPLDVGPICVDAPKSGGPREAIFR